VPKVIVKTRDLDTDEKRFTAYEIDRVPDNALRRGEILAEIVTEHHPKSRQQSLANDVASFVGPNHLIVAKFASEDLEQAVVRCVETGTDDASAGEQDQLFAA